MSFIVNVLTFLKRSVCFKLVSFSIFLISCNYNHDSKLKEAVTVIDYTKTFEFGTIKMGDSILHDFSIKNIGKSPLIIENVNSSCGCTLVEWSANPILPGNSGQIKVMFKSDQNTLGNVKKSVVIRTNTDPIFHVLYLSGEVENI